MKSVAFHTLGCKVNQYETEALKELFIDHEYEIKEFNEKADIYVINTCTVTNVAAKKSRQIISRAKKKNENALVIVVGCYVQNEPDQVAGLEGVNLIIGTDERNQIIEMINDFQRENELIKNVKDIKRVKTYEELKVHHNYGKTRSYIKIQDGCNQFCSYCIIPFTRGPIRSRQPDAIVEEIKQLVANGYKEVVLTGIHLASYGKDLKNINLFDIIKLVNDIDGLERIRLGSLEPTMITEEFVKGIKALDKLCPHYHLSLQSGCNKTLEEMNRKYSNEQYYNGVEILRKHLGNIALTTDIIVGFPGESEEDFLESYNFVQRVEFSEIHVFKYSPREGTKAAARNDQINGNVKEERSSKMIFLGKSMSKAYLQSFLGTSKDVLIEQVEEEGLYMGYTDNYMRVKLQSKEDDIKNKIINITLKAIKQDGNGYYLLGE
ncbi:tRNA (N(6)-L-threonylcarbamoyladenosine(37)-C(2))-methylthiotransferase MtaB [Vallitalea okinawensis]|uniref:tRNA (N(6)-L-threonylcarbamoyladenosine(37)-C(2))- methylthiotransferase MtaB n=1 Tax=Vallitalea okinawensis TaxID=2078660 RepID=UPI000CFD18F6|nr:tRNA (N(6)-L-threonylcarbamoyladenosine(37)-C(2))-methylthiotransferase MtaB [Vallitalea okinawensis]